MKKSIAFLAVASALALPASFAFSQTAPPAGETSDRTPDKASPTPLSQTDSAGGATSDRTPNEGGNSGTAANLKLTQAECETLWKQADASAAGSLSQSQAQSYVSDYKSVDSDANGKLSSAEWMKGCEGGMVKNSASTGSGAGTSGSDTGGSTTKPKN